MLQSDLLAVAIQANVTTLLLGLPGVGKSAIVRQIVQEIEKQKHGGKGFPFVISNAAQVQPEDLGGAPVPNHTDKVMEAYAMGKLKPLVKAQRGCHMIDEYVSAQGPVRAACLSILEGRLYGDTHLPDVSVIAVGNPPNVATDGQDLSTPESNRFFFLNWELSNEVWFNYMLSGPGAIKDLPILPDNWRESVPGAKQTIVRFLQKSPMYVHKMPETAEEMNKPWPSQRAWEKAADFIGALRACGYSWSSDHVAAALAGTVGSSIADVFQAWMRTMDLPDPEDMLADPANAEAMLPKRHDHIMHAFEALAMAAADRNNKKWPERWQTAWDIFAPHMISHPDRVLPAARVMSQSKPAGGKFPPNAHLLLKLRRDIGISESGT